MPRGLFEASEPPSPTQLQTIARSTWTACATSSSIDLTVRPEVAHVESDLTYEQDRRPALEPLYD